MKDDLINGISSRTGLIIRLLGTLLAFALLVYLLSQQGWRDIGVAIKQIPLWRFAAALGLILISRFAVSGRWHVLLRSSGVAISPRQSIRLTFAGLFASNFLPTTIGGDVIRLAGTLQLKYDAVICAASLIVDRLVGLVGMAMAVPFGLPRFIENSYVIKATSFFDNYEVLLANSAFLPGKWWRAGWVKVVDISGRMVKALSLWVEQPRALAMAFIFSWVHMLCLFGAIWLLFSGMGQSLSLWLVGGLYSVVYLVTLLPFSINGYGIQEISMTFVFSSVGGASVQSGLTGAILFRTLMMLASLPGAAFVPGLLPWAKEQARGEAQSQANK